MARPTNTNAIRSAEGSWAREPRVLGTSKIGGVISASCAPAPSPEARAQACNSITMRTHSQPYDIPRRKQVWKLVCNDSPFPTRVVNQVVDTEFRLLYAVLFGLVASVSI